MADFEYTVTHIPFKPVFENRFNLATRRNEQVRIDKPTDITKLVTAIPRISDTGLDVINTAELEMFIPGGDLLTKAPILNEYDKFSIEMTDSGGNVYYNQFAYAPQEDAMVITESKSDGTRVKLKLLGLEYNLQSVMYLSPHRWESGDTVARSIIDMYNTSRGSLQPEAVYHGFLPSRTRNTYPFDDAPESCWDRLQDLAKSFGAPPADGGLLDFFTIECFTGRDGRLNVICRSLGDNRRSTATVGNNKIEAKETPTLESGTLVGDDDTRDFGISPPRANRIIGIFNRSTGSLPGNYSRFVGRSLRWEFLPLHVPSASYIAGEEVRVAGNENVYRARKPVAPNTALTDGDSWEVLSREAFIDTEQYSPWTDDKATLWANCGVNNRGRPVGQQGESPGSRNRVFFGGFEQAMPDFNMAIKNNPEYERYPVDAIISGGLGLIGIDFLLPIVDSDSFGNNQVRRPYRGFRVLVSGNTVHRSFGDVTPNAIIEYDGQKWVDKYIFDNSNIGAAAVSTITGFVVKWDGTAWQNFVQKRNPYPATGGPFTADYDCLHPYESIRNVPGVYSSTGPSANSAVEIEYRFFGLGPFNVDPTTGRPVSNTATTVPSSYFILPTGILGSIIFENISWYRSGACIRFAFPFPPKSYGNIGERVGELYGFGGGSSEILQDTKQDFFDPNNGSLDFSNNRVTHSGKIGLNNDESEDLGNVESVGFAVRISHRDNDTNSLLNEPNSPMIAWFRDGDDNVIINEFTIPFNGVWFHHNIAISSFVPYVPHTPKKVVDYFTVPKQLEALDRFKYYDVREFGIAWRKPYDEVLRFDPKSEILTSTIEQGIRILTRPVESINAILTGRNVKIAIDAFRFNKELRVISSPDGENNINKVFRAPQITTYSEGRFYVKSEEERLRFTKKEFVLDVKGRFDVKYGDTFYYKNPRVVADSDKGIVTGQNRNGEDIVEQEENTIKLAVLAVEHSVTQDGLRSRISGIKRFE